MLRQKSSIFADYEDRKAWAKKMLVNIAKAGFFSSDRTIAQYNKISGMNLDVREGTGRKKSVEECRQLSCG